MPQDLSTHAKESISSLESLQKASKWATSHVIVSDDNCGSLGNAGVERGAQSRIASSIHHELRSIGRIWYREVREFVVHGGLELSEGTSAKSIFDVDIENFRAEFFLHVEKTKIMLVGQGEILISPTHKRTEGHAPVWGSEFTSKDAALQGGSEKLLLG